MIDITSAGATVTNAALVEGDPAVRIGAADVTFINEATGRVRFTGDFFARPAIRIDAPGATIVNREGGRLEHTDSFSFAITGSAGADVVRNAGTIIGQVRLGAGNDRVEQSGNQPGTPSYDLDEGDDLAIITDAPRASTAKASSTARTAAATVSTRCATSATTASASATSVRASSGWRSASPAKAARSSSPG